jgi:hypothetical protein
MYNMFKFALSIDFFYIHLSVELPRHLVFSNLKIITVCCGRSSPLATVASLLRRRRSPQGKTAHSFLLATTTSPLRLRLDKSQALRAFQAGFRYAPLSVLFSFCQHPRLKSLRRQTTVQHKRLNEKFGAPVPGEPCHCLFPCAAGLGSNKRATTVL